MTTVRRDDETLTLDAAAVERVLVIARELDAAGRHDDARLLAHLTAAVTQEVTPALPPEELDRRLQAAEDEIAAGRLTPDEEVWAQLDAVRRGAALPSS
jgi:hypothetical protein